MASVIRFFRSQDKNENKEYKIASIKNLDNSEFKYYELSRTDIVRKGELNVHIDNQSKIICTSAEISFNTDYVLKIEDYEYYIRSIYEEIDSDDNNFFGIKPRKRTYLTIIKDR